MRVRSLHFPDIVAVRVDCHHSTATYGRSLSRRAAIAKQRPASICGTLVTLRRDEVRPPARNSESIGHFEVRTLRSL